MPMKYKPKKTFKESTHKLADNHTWKAPSGYKIFVIDRGAASFNIPASWFLKQIEPLELLDKAPPDDNARLMVSFFRLPPRVDWSDLPLDKLLVQSTEGTPHETLSQSEIFQPKRHDGVELAWREDRFLDPGENRDAFTRIAMARGFDVQLLITCDFWPEDAAKVKPIWDEVLRSIQLGRKIADPLKGDVLH